MINIKYFLSLLAGLLLAGSCNVLDQEPLDSVTPELAFKDQQAAQAALNGLYSRLQSEDYYGGWFQYIADNYADVSTFLGFFVEFREPDERAIPATNGGVEVNWLGIYRAINSANEIIANVPNVEDENFSPEDRATMVAEAHCIRGLCYLDLLTYWGEHWDESSTLGVPLVTQSTNSDFANVEQIPRASVSATYDLIISDLQLAEKDLPASGDRSRVSRALATGLLARTYAFKGDYALAEQKATEIIESGDYALMADYADIFLTDLSDESVFELVFNAQDPSDLALYTIRRDEVRPDPELIESFAADDVRQLFIGEAAGRPGLRLLKAEDFSTDANPAYIMRLAELYLLRAEARFFNSDEAGALADLNTIHTRAGLAPYADAGNFVDKLLDEWRWEFFQEGFRFRALVRLNRAEEVLGIESFRRVYPIPFRELTIEGTLLQQNPGYGN